MKKVGVCLSGGGIRSVAHLGALQALIEMGYEIRENRTALEGQIKDLRDGASVQQRNRWSVNHMQIWSGEFERANATAHMPDVRKISRENEP